jgi:hypothetical protein
MADQSKITNSPTNTEERKFTNLRRFNLVMGFLHLAQGIFMIAISNATTFPIYTNFLPYPPSVTSGMWPS